MEGCFFFSLFLRVFSRGVCCMHWVGGGFLYWLINRHADYLSEGCLLTLRDFDSAHPYEEVAYEVYRLEDV